ncbi:MAG: EamA family transporter [Acidobacteria bacterium]|nr:EamA family transporter [Acidobacteriota bacterium]
MESPNSTQPLSPRTLHWLGVTCGFGAGAWLGAAEAPTKLVTAGFSPFIISLGMVAGVFVARWTVPMLLKGTGYIWLDLKEKKHLIVWAILAGMLWAVANTLTVFAIRNVGLSIAFPLWNTNSLVGLLWGWLLFNELRKAGAAQWLKVLGGAACIVVGACVLAYATAHQAANGPQGAATLGICAALGAGLLWGTMYIPYRKAYISGMNPLSFVTVFTFGELGTVFALSVLFGGGYDNVMADLSKAKPVLFWLFLGGFCWVLGDLFQQYAAKYIGIGRGIPLSNTNQLWGLAWGALVFGELAGQTATAQTLVIAGSLIMIAGAAAISFAEAPESEQTSWRSAMTRECERYGMDPARVEASLQGEDVISRQKPRRHWWESLVGVAAVGIFVWLGLNAEAAPIHANTAWMAILSVATVGFLIVCGWLLWRRTKFS